MGIEPAYSLQAVVLAVLFSGVVSMPKEAILLKFGVSKKDLVDNFQMGTETALGRANIIRTTTIETLQAFIMYMVSSSYKLHEISSSLKSSSAAVFSSTHSCVYKSIYLVLAHQFNTLESTYPALSMLSS